MVRDLKAIFKALGKSLIDSASIAGWLLIVSSGIISLIDYEMIEPTFKVVRLVMLFAFVVMFVLMFPSNLKIAKYEVYEENR